jgi:predicted acyl esterase
MARFQGEGCQRAERRHVRLQPLLASLHAGDRLRLSVGLAAWPQVAVNPGDGSLPLEAASAGHRVITVVLALTDSRLCMLPMVRAN